MKIENINLSYSLKGAALDLISLVDFPIDGEIVDSPYKLKSITGLNPPSTNVAISDQVDSGGTNLGANPVNREIVMIVGFQPNYAAGQSVADLRQALYTKLFPRYGRHMTFSIQDSNRTTLLSVIGQVKNVDADIFSKEPQVVITMACYGPYLRKWNQQKTQISLLSKDPLPLTCNGNAPTGFYMELQFTGFTSLFSFTDENDDRLAFFYNFINGDIISFDTTPGRRTARILRGVDDDNLMPYLTSDSVWLQLYEGINNIQPNTQNFFLKKIILNENYWGV